MRDIPGSYAVFILSMIGYDSCHGCLTIDKDPNVSCAFPFTYQGTTYSECTNATDQDGKLWCATKVDKNGFYIKNSKQWGYCSDQCRDRDFDANLRSVDDDINERDEKCGGGASCIYQDNCPKFLEKKKSLKDFQRDSQEYKEALEKIKKSVCNRSEKRVCCPHPKKKEDARCGQGSGISCFKEDQCKYTQALRQKLKDGDTGAKQELIGLICDRKERTFCCPDVDVDENVDKGVDIRKNKKKGPSWLPGKGECGLPEIPASNVLGGVDTTPGMFPFTALLGYPVKERKWVQRYREYRIIESTRFKCGGTLISHWYVLTAAHCQGSSESSQISTVRLGEWEVGRDSGLKYVQDFDITSDLVKVHENYQIVLSNVKNDIALIKLPRPAVLNNGVGIVCLPLNPVEAARELNIPDIGDGLTGTMPNVVGWGYTEYDPWAGNLQGDFAKANVASTVQQRLAVPVLSSTACAKKFIKFEPNVSQLCAGGELGKDSCKGDSGGPLYLSKVTPSGEPTYDGTEPWYLIGVVSFGSRHCGAGKPGVYSRVEYFLPWIKTQIGYN